MNGTVRFITTTQSTTTYPYTTSENMFNYLEDIEEIYMYTSIPCILLSLMTVTLNIFIIRFYWKRELTIVPLLYTLIASLDIICAIGVIYKYIAVLLLFEDYSIEYSNRAYELYNGNTLHTQDIHAMIFFFLIQVSYKCSVFCNLVLAVSRTIMILKPFYQINLKMVKLACILYAVPWIAFNGLNIYKFKSGRWQAPAAVLPPEGWHWGRGPEGPEDKGHGHSRARRAREWPKHASPRARRA